MNNSRDIRIKDLGLSFQNKLVKKKVQYTEPPIISTESARDRGVNRSINP